MATTLTDAARTREEVRTPCSMWISALISGADGILVLFIILVYFKIIIAVLDTTDSDSLCGFRSSRRGFSSWTAVSVPCSLRQGRCQKGCQRTATGKDMAIPPGWVFSFCCPWCSGTLESSPCTCMGAPASGLCHAKRMAKRPNPTAMDARMRNGLNAEAAAPWRHLPKAVRPLRLNSDVPRSTGAPMCAGDRTSSEWSPDLEY